MSGFQKVAVVGMGDVGGFIVKELLKQKAASAVEEIIIVTHPVRLFLSDFNSNITTSETLGTRHEVRRDLLIRGGR